MLYIYISYNVRDMPRQVVCAMMGVISFSNISVTVEEGEKRKYEIQGGD